MLRHPFQGGYVWEVDASRRATVIVGDARDWNPAEQTSYHGIYFDPFAPDGSPELWQLQLLQRMRNVLHPSGRLVTYAVSRQVRDLFAEAGLTVERMPGSVGGKREVLFAHR